MKSCFFFFNSTIRWIYLYRTTDISIVSRHFSNAKWHWLKKSVVVCYYCDRVEDDEDTKTSFYHIRELVLRLIYKSEFLYQIFVSSRIMCHIWHDDTFTSLFFIYEWRWFKWFVISVQRIFHTSSKITPHFFFPFFDEDVLFILFRIVFFIVETEDVM